VSGTERGGVYRGTPSLPGCGLQSHGICAARRQLAMEAGAGGVENMLCSQAMNVVCG